MISLRDSLSQRRSRIDCDHVVQLRGLGPFVIEQVHAVQSASVRGDLDPDSAISCAEARGAQQVMEIETLRLIGGKVESTAPSFASGVGDP